MNHGLLMLTLMIVVITVMKMVLHGLHSAPQKRGVLGILGFVRVGGVRDQGRVNYGMQLR